MRIAPLLFSLIWLACGNTAGPVPPHSSVSGQPGADAAEDGVFLAPSASETYHGENQLYVSLWHENGETALSLLCDGPCLPNVPKDVGTPEAYRSEHVRQVEPHVWEAAMAPKGFVLRLDLRAQPAKIEFDGRAREAHRMNFHDAAYDRVSPYERDALLFEGRLPHQACARRLGSRLQRLVPLRRAG
jgi:hypothetical protein